MPDSPVQTEPVKTLEQRVKEAQARIQAVLSEYHLQMGGIADFPLYKKLPAEVELALKVIARHEGVFTVAFQEKKEVASGTANES